MKRYIRASFDSSIPAWAKNALSKGNVGDKFVQQYKVPLSEVQFYEEKMPNSVPIYLLGTDYGDVVYIPKVNGDQREFFNGRHRTLDSLSKSTLNKLMKDIVWVDTSNKLANTQGYKDPRYSYDRYDRKGKGSYAGQYYSDYNGEWSKMGVRPNNEISSRDKSGYKIPKPEEQLRRYYEKFPDKITQKVDALYDRIIDVRDKVMSPEIIKSPYNRDEEMDIGNAIYRMHDAITRYRELLNMLDDAGNLKQSDHSWSRGNELEQFSDAVKNISDSLDSAERGLTSRW